MQKFLEFQFFYSEFHLCWLKEYPESSSQFSIRQLSGKFQILKADLLSWSLVPGKKYSQLEGRDLQVVLPNFILKSDLPESTQID